MMLLARVIHCQLRLDEAELAMCVSWRLHVVLPSRGIFICFGYWVNNNFNFITAAFETGALVDCAFTVGSAYLFISQFAGF